MSGNAPVSAGEEDGAVVGAVGGLVGSENVGRGAAPDFEFVFGGGCGDGSGGGGGLERGGVVLLGAGEVRIVSSEGILLVVTSSKDCVSARTKEEGNDVHPHLIPTQVSIVTVKVLRLQGVHEWQPDTVAPCEVEAKMVVGNVDGAEVPVFMVEKVDNV